jgi:hypothetical protein
MPVPFTTTQAFPLAGVAELRLLLRLVRGDAPFVERALADRPDSLNTLAGIAACEGLSVVLLRALERSPFVAGLASARRDVLEQRRHRQGERLRALREALDNLAQRFAIAGQPFLLLKGPYLAARFYGDVAGREFVDIDLLVPRRQRAAACARLIEAGYQRKSRILISEGLSAFFVHGFDFVAGPVNLDLHWALSRQGSLRLDEESIWARRGAYILDGRSYDVLGDEDEIVFATLGLMRDIERGRPKLKNILDLVQIVAAGDGHLDWDGLFAAGRKDGTYGPLVNVLGLCLDFADAHDLAPRLSAALTSYSGHRVPLWSAGPLFRFSPVRLGLGNKLWAARSYDGTLASWLLWWSASLPFRVAVHRRRKPPGPVNI